MSQAFFEAGKAQAGRRISGRLSLAAASDLLAGFADRVPPGACRFLVAGGLSSLVNWLARFPLSVALPYGIAVAAAYAVGMVAGFGLYRSWVFPGSPLSIRAQCLRFVMVNSVGLSSVVVAAQILVALIERTGLAGLPIAEAAGHGVAIVFGAVINFAGHRAVTFARSTMAAPSFGSGALSRVAGGPGSR